MLVAHRHSINHNTRTFFRTIENYYLQIKNKYFIKHLSKWSLKYTYLIAIIYKSNLSNNNNYTLNCIYSLQFCMTRKVRIIKIRNGNFFWKSDFVKNKKRIEITK